MGKFNIQFDIDKRNKIFCLLPTIIWQPKKYRYYGSCIIDITWLIFHITIGTWERPKNDEVRE